jgi:prolyl oligopeptidase
VKLLIIFCLYSLSSFAQLHYPNVKKIKQVEYRFGEQIWDEYKWMENHADPDLWNWIEEQKELTNSILDPNVMEHFSKRTLDFRKLKQSQSSTQKNFISFSVENEFDFKAPKKKRVIKWSRHFGFKSNVFQKESSLYSYELRSVASGDLQRLIISQKSDNKLIDILHVKFFDFVSWADDKSFYYISDLDQNMGGGRPGLYRHTVGDAQSEDVLILRGKSDTSSLVIHQLGEQFYVEVDDQIGTLQLPTGKVTNRHNIEGEVVEMVDAPSPEAIILTFKNANFGEFQKLRLRDGKRDLFLGEQKFVLEKTRKLDESHHLIMGLFDGANVSYILKDNLELFEIPLFDGTLNFLKFHNEEIYLSHETFSTPKTIYAFHLETLELRVISREVYPIEIEARKIFYKAASHQDASLWVMTKKGVELTPATPLILYGYGGFRVSITPSFGIYESLSWLEKGGAFAVATLPGSLDQGESWYQLARVAGRINAFDSFAQAAKELFARGWTSPEHIGIMGASNGGTLTAGTMERHTSLFKAAVPIVGVMDLLNFTLFTAGKYWMADYGNPFVESDFQAIFPLSPYHNLKPKNYPATMVMTAEFDDRVVPMHSYKYAARLQELNTSSSPILLYHKEWGGHARASGSERESSRFVAAFYTFFSGQLGL